jgi:hypothetical protein
MDLGASMNAAVRFKYSLCGEYSPEVPMTLVIDLHFFRNPTDEEIEELEMLTSKAIIEVTGRSPNVKGVKVGWKE